MRLLQLLRRLSLPAALVLAAAARAQGPIDHPPVDPRNIVTASLSRPLDITSAWLFHEGDDPAFASPTLDDSRWRPVLSEKPLAAQGITYPKFVWYRTHVHVPPHQHSIAILLRRFRGSEQVFVNGVLTGPSSDFPPGGRSTDTVDMIAPLPDYLIDGGDLVIAIRADIEFAARSIPANPGFDLFTAIWVGDTTVLSSLSSLYNFRALSSNVTNDALTFLVLLIALALAFSLRDEREYPALCLFLAGSGVSEAIAIWRSLHETVYKRWSDIPGQMLLLVSIVAGVEFARMVLRLPRSRWIVVYEWLIVACISAGSILSFSFYDAGIPPRPVLYFILASVASLLAPLYLGLPIFALWVWRRNRNLDALLLSVPLLIKSMFFYVQIGVIVLHLAHLTKREYLQPAATTMFYFRWDQVAEFFFLLALLGFLILRTVRLARARAALAAEFAAAENVQQLLLARASQPTPGFSVETAFHPASEVGGDFFLVLPSEDRLIAIVGDVSGKGLTAAMRVAMILGILRRETSRSPSTILANLNEALLTQSGMGFTTACCVHLCPDGSFTVANAGHIPPYLAGVELGTPPALPLGIAADQAYHLVRGHLATGETMVLMSDGVPEARNARRELYGFDRLPHLTLLPAHDIAATALRFGQEDDITVLTIAVA